MPLDQILPWLKVETEMGVQHNGWCLLWPTVLFETTFDMVVNFHPMG